MIQDFFMNPNIERYDLSSIRRLAGGGAAMPAAVAQRLLHRGITYCEGYGLSETMAATHITPPPIVRNSNAWAYRSMASIRASSILPPARSSPQARSARS
jgi:acyl-CoA synthetase (AMP-forming)/AMP-acid ligase II